MGVLLLSELHLLPLLLAPATVGVVPIVAPAAAVAYGINYKRSKTKARRSKRAAAQAAAAQAAERERRRLWAGYSQLSEGSDTSSSKLRTAIENAKLGLYQASAKVMELDLANQSPFDGQLRVLVYRVKAAESVLAKDDAGVSERLSTGQGSEAYASGSVSAAARGKGLSEALWSVVSIPRMAYYIGQQAEARGPS